MKKAGRIKVGDNDADVVPAFDGHAHVSWSAWPGRSARAHSAVGLAFTLAIPSRRYHGHNDELACASLDLNGETPGS